MGKQKWFEGNPPGYPEGGYYTHDYPHSCNRQEPCDLGKKINCGRRPFVIESDELASRHYPSGKRGIDAMQVAVRRTYCNGDITRGVLIRESTSTTMIP